VKRVWELGQRVTDGTRVGKVVMLVKYSATLLGPAVIVQVVETSLQDEVEKLPYDVTVSEQDYTWRELRTYTWP
jgi:hypothetical protein